MSKVTANKIAFATMKGGTGKTMMSYNLGCMLARDKNVLMVDLDPQCNLSSNFMCDIYDETLPSVGDIFIEESADFETPAPIDIVEFGPLEELPNLDLIPSTMYLYGVELSLVPRTMREMILRTYMEEHAEFFNHYDYIIFDTAPNFGIITQNCLLVSNHVVLVTDPDVNSPRGADIFLSHWNKIKKHSMHGDVVDGFILNNVERTKMSRKTIAYINSHPELSKIMFNKTIPHSTRYKECGEQNLPIHLLRCEREEEKSRVKAERAMEELLTEMRERGIV